MLFEGSFFKLEDAGELCASFALSSPVAASKKV